MWIVGDNLHTMLVDDFVVNYTTTSSSSVYSNNNNNLNLVLNLKHLVLNRFALSYLHNVWIEFLREPIVFKFGLQPQLGSNLGKQRVLKIIGLNLNNNQQLLNDFNGLNRTTDSSDDFESEMPKLLF